MIVQSVRAQEVPDLRLAAIRTAELMRDASPEMAQERHQTSADVTRTMDMLADRLTEASLWWVKSEMMDVLEVAAEKMPPQPLEPEDIPDPTGLVVFERPLLSTDFKTGIKDVPISAMSWTPVIVGSARRQCVDIECWGLFEVGGRRRMVPMAGTTWPLESDAESLDNPSHVEDCRRLAALWSLTATERISEVERRPTDRAARRRSAREGVDVSGVRIVRLRRARGESSDVAGAQAHYSHRFIVNGFWRNQWLPSRQAHRQQWIAPYIKGPADKPLVVKETVKAWVA